ncbi:Peptidylprolyl isomerase domain and WD repeat containing protein 1 [Clydaea vesicula]|uniref:Peptidylprolyl isomerase domain and WD repeat containing protein 1 n=1 Tax=Clydaea vesicula TaxID=447962 RepID=A0AAD5U249_9FUNG|nr:Peptidylprolyl isomerase domain and WD repeat containing protein 1 [Clydaea vesicula]
MPKRTKPESDDENDLQANNHNTNDHEEAKDESNVIVDDPGSDSDSDIGPQPLGAADLENVSKKKAKILKHERVYIENLPSTTQYEKSLMHRDVVNFVTTTKTDFILTTSIDGHVKFWKKSEEGIEFVKHFKAHLGAIVCRNFH